MEKWSIEDFVNVKSDERKAYILKELQLEELWALGIVRNAKENKPFFFIDNLVNPYTAVALKKLVIDGKQVMNSIYCSLPDGVTAFEDGTLVLVKFNIVHEKHKLQSLKPFATSFEHVHVAQNKEQLQQLSQIIQLDVPLLALVSPAYTETEEEQLQNVFNLVLKQVQTEQEKLAKYEEEQQSILEKKHKILKSSQQKFNETVKQIEEARLKLVELGFTIENYSEFTRDENNNQKLEIPDKKSEFLKLIQEQLAVRGYQYDVRLLRQFLTATATGQMILLVGPSGTGKTSIIKQLADVLNANYEIIPVQPSWTDKQDLVGFYNPLRQLFVPTAFLDCLVKAKNTPEQLFFICLDEMNLAQIEYYLADILSIREVPNEKLRLYSDFEREQNMREIQWYVQRVLKSKSSVQQVMNNPEIETKEFYEYVTRYNNMETYPAKIDIPSNVRFIGTMNVDGAVQAISSKIIDRSFIIPVLKQTEKVKVEEDKQVGSFDLKPLMWSFEMSKPISTQLRGALNKLQSSLENVEISFNTRVENHVKAYYNAAQLFSLDTKQQFDDLALMKLLPRIHDTIEEGDIRELKDILTEYGEKDSLALKKLENMELKLQKTGLLSYWS